MTDNRTQGKRIPLLCRLLGHKWKPTHMVGTTQPYGLRAWIYVDDICQRCYATEYRLPHGDSHQDQLPHVIRSRSHG